MSLYVMVGSIKQTSAKDIMYLTMFPSIPSAAPPPQIHSGPLSSWSFTLAFKLCVHLYKL